MQTRFAGYVALMLALWLAATGAMAQNTPPIDRTAAIVLGVGDVVQVTVRNHAEMDTVVAIPSS
ncbi:MAG TPA: hypothetical protein VKU00_25090, partial [Chthonomonadaceae bacterium]|nr:hypothetical protein [Chthonomonadaceae bacterium]